LLPRRRGHACFRQLDTENEEHEMFETTVTLVGRLITPLKQITFTDGTFMVSGRMVCTERRVDRATGQWIDGQTLFITVVCKRGLAENAFLSLRSGDPVIAHGRLRTREYEKDGVQRSVIEMEARSVGPDLQWCTAAVTKKSRTQPAGTPSDDPWAAGGAQLHRDVGADQTAEVDDAGLRGLPSDDPWRDPEPVGLRSGEAAVGV
jgi:single-strand DNA-binding protein